MNRSALQCAFTALALTALFITPAIAAEDATVPATAPAPAAEGFTIAAAERLTLNIPFYHERVTRHMHRANTHSERVALYRIELANGVVGWGECPPGVPPERLENLIGRNAFDFLYSGSVRFGVEMALMDAVGRSLGVPAYKLIGGKVRDRVPISWWMIDMPPEDWAAEIEESVRRGYTSAKIKARPWRDLIPQLKAIAEVAPENYRVMIDYNGFLLTAENALQYLKQLDDMPLVEGHESAIYFGSDYDGVRMLAGNLNKLIVDHYSDKHVMENAGDGFLLGVNYGSLAEVRRQNALCAAQNKPYWLQMVGTGLTAAYAVQIGAVMSHAKMPAVTCHELWEHDLLKERIEVVDGFIRVPEGPGLGVEVDEEAIRHYQVDPDTPTPRDLYHKNPPTVRIIIPNEDGGETVLTFTNESAYYQPFLKGEYPVFVPGVRLETADEE